MANMPAEDIATMLENDELGTKTTNIFVDMEPGGDEYKIGDPLIIIYNTGGFPPEATGKIFRKPTINIRVKGIDGGYTAAEQKIQAIADALHQRTPETVAGTDYTGIWQVGEVAFVEFDENSRPVFTANFRMHRKYN